MKTLIASTISALVAATSMIGAQPVASVSVASKALTSKQASVVRGSGSTCRDGCNEGPSCDNWQECFTVPTGTGIGTVCYDRSTQYWWNPHRECAFAFGEDTCRAGTPIACQYGQSYSGPCGSGGGTGTPTGGVFVARTSSPCL